MQETIREVLAVDAGTKWTFRIIAVAFSALCIWMYLYRNGLPDGLAAMTTGAWASAIATIQKAKDRVEVLINKDIDGDGKIGENTAQPTPVTAQVIAEPTSATTVTETGPI